MGWLLPFAVRFAFFVARDGAFFPFFPALGFAFFGLADGRFAAFLTLPVAALLAAFFGEPLDFFFFFFKVLLLWTSYCLKCVDTHLIILRARSVRGAHGIYGCEDFINCW